MSLRARLFLLFGGLVAVLVLGQWLLVRSLTRELSAELGEVAVSVGRNVISGVEAHVVTVTPGTTLRNLEEMPAGEDGLPDIVERARHLEHLAEESGMDVNVRVIRRDEAGEILTEDLRPGVAVIGVAAEDVDAASKDPGMAYEFKTATAEDTDEGHRVVREFFDIDETSDGSGRITTTRFELTLDQPADARTLFLHGPQRVEAIPIPRTGVNDALDRTSNRLFLGSLGILGAGLLVAGFVAHRVTRPLRGLAAAARTVGGGELGAQAPVHGGGEVAEAITSFNHMSGRLKKLDEHARELRARQHLTELGEIARGMAHTLRNPLNALGLSLEELASRAPEEQQSDDLVASARRQIRRIDHSIRSFLAAASGGAGTVEEINMATLVQDVVLEVLQDNRQRSSINIEDDASGPRTVRGVGAELRAVVQALVVNAVEASPEGGRVTVRFAAPGEKAGAGPAGQAVVRLEIEDQGAGLPAEVRQRLFTPHVTTKATGSGMGLFLAHRIATTRYAGLLALEDLSPLGTRAVLEISDRETNEEDG